MELKEEDCEKADLSHDNAEFRMRYKITLSFSIILAMIIFCFGLVNLIVGKIYVGATEVSGSIFMLIYNLYKLIRKKSIMKPIYIITFLIASMGIYLYWSGGFGKTGMVWCLTLPGLFISLHKLKNGMRLVFLQLLAMGTLFILSRAGIVHIAYGGIETLALFLAYGLVSYILYYYEHCKILYREEIQKLEGLLPICSRCKNIRDDKGHWQPVDSYMNQKTDLEFSHGICPDCMKELYPDMVDDQGNIKSKIK